MPNKKKAVYFYWFESIIWIFIICASREKVKPPSHVELRNSLIIAMISALSLLSVSINISCLTEKDQFPARPLFFFFFFITSMRDARPFDLRRPAPPIDDAKKIKAPARYVRNIFPHTQLQPMAIWPHTKNTQRDLLNPPASCTHKKTISTLNIQQRCPLCY